MWCWNKEVLQTSLINVKLWFYLSTSQLIPKLASGLEAIVTTTVKDAKRYGLFTPFNYLVQ